ncbi:hypothetical protein [Holdemanella biformis]|uniref:hypothetical protein n=1 Tax=Holdemanella biformis TaxID=1735 RepID=UPI00249369F1|nr:hypothetical protein [Holdemanella biformis]
MIEIEHIVQFGISIDDEQIKKTIEKNAMQQVVATFRNDIVKEMIGKNNYTKSDYSTMMWNAIHKQIETFLDENREKIIEIASEKLADKLAKTKKVKDMVTNTINNLLE